MDYNSLEHRSYRHRLLNLLDVWLPQLVPEFPFEQPSEWIDLLKDFAHEARLLRSQQSRRRYESQREFKVAGPLPKNLENYLERFIAELEASPLEAAAGVIAHHLSILFSYKAELLGEVDKYWLEDLMSQTLGGQQSGSEYPGEEASYRSGGEQQSDDNDGIDNTGVHREKPMYERAPRPIDYPTDEQSGMADPFSATPASMQRQLKRELASVEISVSVPATARSEHNYLESRKYTVWFGTNRQIEESETPNKQLAFSDITGESLHFGHCMVYVPRSHEFGKLKSSWVKKTFRRLLGKEDDALQLESTTMSSPEAFQAGVYRELQHWNTRTALVFVHGYNVSFEEAALRAAQIGFDLRVEGITALFSWGSRGSTALYTHDSAAIELAEKHFVDFLINLSAVEGLQEINILTHSMGNRLLCRTVEKIVALRSQGFIRAPVGHVVLAAADVTAAFFKQYASWYGQLASKRITNYTHKGDRALALSEIVNGQERVGLEPPVFVHDGLDTVSVSALDLDLLGHGYVASAAPLLYDIADLIHNNKPPQRRIRCQAHKSKKYWVLTR